ncbi:LuxR C-terminal-related transcriptional regulator [Legionella cincinnatiensis]|uniref:Transcription regulator protein, response regulator containing CheY-like receiver domain and HTH DNA-binding domain n=1 Tax=Legionella cincinnatiensis TaxID=28085 RepID=A0A378ILJ8_9GAMM|nr:LuxR C-terminal-related transcriptional regulator [Legionella cincinnatiensis]KTC89189.1 putative Transcriptional regulator, LuxR family protein [Legionella cincinnatiensis]STX35381.1 transcription regulator protein, response regulator containing CheY-like receiver domain and HTH DNA-binding domain [Legionella cincinnatiensis]
MDENVLENFMRQSHLLNDLCEPLFLKYGVNFFRYMEIHESGDFIGLINNLKYYEFVASQMQKNDLFLSAPLWSIKQYPQSGTYLSYLRDTNGPEILQKVARKFGIGNFFTIVNKEVTKEGILIKIFVYGTDINNININQYYLRDLKLFQEFSHYFNKRMLRLLSTMDRASPSRHLTAAINQAVYNFDWEKDTLETINVQDKIIKIKQDIRILNLTKREQQIIAEYMQGLNHRETADKLFISKKTVERHFENIRAKLNCSTKDEIVSKLMDKGYFYIEEP